jgi:two-component system, OmpR family, phosphate regulon sensor histidine kinase PhoR
MGSRVTRGLLRLLALLALAVVLGGLYALAAQALQAQHRAALSAALEADARRLARDFAAGALAAERDAAAVPPPCPAAAGLRLWIVRAGDAPACSAREALPADAALAAARVEALGGRSVHGLLDLPRPTLAVTLPLRSGGRVVAAVQALRAPLPATPGLTRLRGAFALGGLALAAALWGLARLGARGQRRRVAELAAELTDLAGTDTAQPRPPRGGPRDAVLGPLEAALQQAGVAIQARLERLTQGLDEREAVLASMVEGVLAVEPGGRLLELNAAAGHLFEIDPALARGRDLLEAVRHPELVRFVREAQASPAPLERELIVYAAEPRTLQVHGTALRDAHGRGLGTLVVLNDVTHLRRLERMRQDFVANVSHEIKTPITSIKGFVETLLDGALEDPPTARRFLEIVARHAERLNAITEDLLNLSRIEQEAERGALHGEEVALAALLRGALQLCAARAEARRIRLTQDCAETLHARLNPQLVEQAVVNLVDNAVKYTPAGTEVRVEAQRDGSGSVIRVRDQGPGIPAEHLPRLFERFYRVDKARSRKAGGTGLGLAIVKHIAQAHGGRVEVESRMGEGSTFSLHLPDVPPAVE